MERVILPSIETPTLTKAELADLLFERLGLNKRESKDMVEAFFEFIHDSLVNGKDVKLSGDLSADRETLKNALPKASISGATGPFKFRPAKTKDGKVGGWDADQKPFIYVVRGGKFTLFEGK